MKHCFIQISDIFNELKNSIIFSEIRKIKIEYAEEYINKFSIKKIPALLLSDDIMMLEYIADFDKYGFGFH